MKKAFLLSILLLVCIAACAAALFFGGSSLAAGEIVTALLHPYAPESASTILWHIRMPRILLGLVTGFGLAASGCVFQGMLRNPLADPYTLGISGGAAFGATLGMIMGGTGSVFLPLWAFAGTLVAVVLVYTAASRREFSNATLILSGVILGFIFSSLVLLVFALADSRQVHAAILWLMGDLSTAQPAVRAAAFIGIPPAVALLAVFSRELDILSLGDEKASHLGVEPGLVKKILFITASFITALCVCAAGVVGFVGLMIPHIMRYFVGGRHRLLLPASALAGGAFLVLCDAAARSLMSPMELPVGVITGLVGGLFFLSFLFRRREEPFI